MNTIVRTPATNPTIIIGIVADRFEGPVAFIIRIGRTGPPLLDSGR